MTKPETIDSAEYRRRAKLDPPTGAPKKRSVPELVAMGKAKVAMPLRANVLPEFRLVLPMLTPQLNDLIRAKGQRWAGAYNKIKQSVSQEVQKHWRDFGCPMVKGPYQTGWEFIRSTNRVDPDNIFTAGIKIILDAMTWCGAIENDSARFHKGPLLWLDWPEGNADVVIVTVRAVSGKF
jgi:hypothetical protein